MRYSKIFPVLLASVLMILTMAPGVVSAQDGISVDPKVQKAQEDNEALAQEKGIPPVDENIKKQIDEWHKQVVLEREKLIRPAGEGEASITQTDIPKGTNYTFYYADEGNNWDTSWLLADADTSYVLAQNRNNVGAWTWGVGSASGWAWTGRRFNITGSGSQLCYVDFVGWAGVNLLGGYSGSASWEVVVKVYDATVGSYIGQSTVFQEESTNNQLIVDGGDYNNSVLVSLQAGHQYVVQVITFGDVSQYGIFISTMESGTDSLHTLWDEVRLRWQ